MHLMDIKAASGMLPTLEFQRQLTALRCWHGQLCTPVLQYRGGGTVGAFAAAALTLLPGPPCFAHVVFYQRHPAVIIIRYINQCFSFMVATNKQDDDFQLAVVGLLHP
jgi:hypothetical protein